MDIDEGKEKLDRLAANIAADFYEYAQKGFSISEILVCGFSALSTVAKKVGIGKEVMINFLENVYKKEEV